MSAALIAKVEPLTPADDAGFEPGYCLTAVDGQPLRDLIDWRWLSADDVITVDYLDPEGEPGRVELEREEGESWGFEFDQVIFDEVKLCRNACTFCFMRQLPANMRPSLYLRDDDFRLSFLTGNFVTFTNLSPEDEERIVSQAISPLRVSLHAVDPGVRRRLIGPHAQKGLETLERLLEKGIQFHAQIVLVPGQNDGKVLRETLAWAYDHPGILNVGVVPLGYTRHQSQFASSFNDPGQAREVLDTLAPFQQRALRERQVGWVFAADEFYRNAYGSHLLEHLPPRQAYGNFEMFEDGIGIIRYYVDDFAEAQKEGLFSDLREALAKPGSAYDTVRYLVGYAMQPLLDILIENAGVSDYFRALTVPNDFFGGNVDVTGLLCAEDIIHSIGEANQQRTLFVIPSVVFNDDGLTLDGQTLDDIREKTGASVEMVSCNPTEYIPEINEMLLKDELCHCR